MGHCAPNTSVIESLNIWPSMCDSNIDGRFSLEAESDFSQEPFLINTYSIETHISNQVQELDGWNTASKHLRLVVYPMDVSWKILEVYYRLNWAAAPQSVDGSENPSKLTSWNLWLWLPPWIAEFETSISGGAGFSAIVLYYIYIYTCWLSGGFIASKILQDAIISREA